MARKYTAAEGASGWTKLGKARRKIAKTKRKTAIVQGAASMAGSVAAFGIGQANKAKTAWGEYETGYEALGGEGFERPKFGQKGYFKGPEGEITINKKIYDRKQIQKAGLFLGSDAAAVLDQTTLDKYLERTAPGRTEATTFTSSLNQPLMSTGGKYGVQGLQERIETGGTGVGVRTGFGQGDKGQFLDQARRQKVQTDRSAMEAEFTGWEAHDVARKKWDIEDRKNEQAQFLQNYRTGFKDQQKTAWGDYMANPPTLSEDMLGQVEKGRQAYGQNQISNEQVNFYNENPIRNAYETSNLSRNKQDLEDEYGTKLGGTFGTGSLSKGY